MIPEATVLSSDRETELGSVLLGCQTCRDVRVIPEATVLSSDRETKLGSVLL